jgi:DNA end-binding protein Ku
MAEALVESLSAAEFEPKKYRDNYREQVLDLIERKAAGEEFEAPGARSSAAR